MSDPTRPEPSPEVARVLVENHRSFLAFLERRVGSREIAEDLLQEAFTRGIDRAGTLRDDESALAWFYRALRNAVIDHYRRDDTRRRGLERFAVSLEPSQPDQELHDAVCRCVLALAATLKPEYAEAIQSIDVEGMPVKDFAARSGISSSNAGVRVFRAREALRKQVARACGTCAEHGCLDCSCQSPSIASTSSTRKVPRSAS